MPIRSHERCSATLKFRRERRLLKLIMLHRIPIPVRASLISLNACLKQIRTASPVLPSLILLRTFQSRLENFEISRPEDSFVLYPLIA